MASLESLPPDQRAVLELVLRRGRSYDQIGEMLGIDRAGVRERALAALDALGPSTGVPAQRRALITDYLLGALPGPVADEVRNRLATSAGERAWARVVASELQEISSEPLPEIPAEAPAAAPEPEPEAAPVRRRRAEVPAPGKAAKAAARPASRTGGALLLAGAALVVAAVVAAIIATSGGSSSKTQPAAKPSTQTSAATPTTGSTTPSKVQPLRQINLKSPSGGKAVGVAEILRENGQIGVAIVAQGLAANTKSPPNAYAVWLYNSPSDAHILGFVNPPVGNDGKLRTAGGFPSNASHFHTLLITLETQSNPKTPGTIVLQGPLSGIP